jgi:hypothetical protein
MFKKKWSLILSVFLALVTILYIAVPASAATTATITVTSTPAFIGISIAQNTWTVNGIDGNTFSNINTTYYSNATGASGDVTAPENPVVDGDCYFTMANTSTIPTNITANMVDFTGGDASANINTGYATNGAGTYGASTYISGAAWPAAAVILKSAASAAMKASLAASTALKFGVAIKTQSGAWAAGTGMTSTITVTATAA